MLGLILLVGIAKKSSILIVDFTNQIRDRGIPCRQALLEACPVRLRPILMTSMATIAGAIPHALAIGPGAEVQRPMALALVGGMIVSTAITLFVVPAGYSVLDDLLGRGPGRREPRDVPIAIEKVGAMDAGRTGIVPFVPVRVVDVLPGSSTEAGGMKKGDVILSIEAEPLTPFRDVSSIVSARAEKPTRFPIRRGNQKVLRRVGRAADAGGADGRQPRRGNWVGTNRYSFRPPASFSQPKGLGSVARAIIFATIRSRSDRFATASSSLAADFLICRL